MCGLSKSFWLSDCNMPHFPSLKEDAKTDVLIIGGGIAGILTAHFLEKRGVDYILVEQDEICQKTTANTTAKITFQHGLIYDKLINSCGTETAQMYLRGNMAAAKMFAKLCKDIDCDYSVKDNFVYSVNDRAKLEKEVLALAKIGYKAQFCEKVYLPIKTVGAVCFKEQAQFHPLKFLAEISKDLNILEHTKVKEMVGNTAICQNGKITAKRVVVATHFPFINKHGSYFLKLYQHRSYVIALKDAHNVNAMYVDEDKKGLSFRSHNEYLLLGGGSHRTGKKGGNYNELIEFSKKNYPSAKIEYRWATQDCMSLDDMPYIGAYSKRTTAFYTASGFNKWGMTGSMLAAMILSDILTDTENKYAAIFSPSRSILKPQLLVNGFETTTNLLTPTKKRCPHLGCALKWNETEHSWDCPCHGSRFSKSGKVLDNPATGNLK